MRERHVHITFITTSSWFVSDNHLSVISLIGDKGSDKLRINPTIENSARPFTNHRN